jgi:glycosyltransferase involved in cell wall biosynthesis
MMRIAIVHDALCVAGGAERLALRMAQTFPDAPVFTSVYLPDQTFHEFRNLDVRILPFANRIKSEEQFKSFLPLWFFLIRRLDFKDFDVVLSSSTYLAKYIRPAKSAVHKSYIHAPFRLLWKTESYTPDSIPNPNLFRPILKLTLPFLRNLDRRLTRQIPEIATSCNNVAREIETIYKRTPAIINPPISIAEYPLSTKPGEYYLSVSRLISHKRVDIAVQACTHLHKKLIVVGDGPERKNLEQLAGESVHFVGRVSDDELKYLYIDSKALIFPSCEDYGIVPLEAQACGRPVIAFGQGGVLETVQDEKTGLFFQEQTVDSLEKCIQRFENMEFHAKEIRRWSTKFDFEIFKNSLQEFVLNSKSPKQKRDFSVMV